MCNGLVMIYMGPDQTDYPHMWGTLDGKGASPQGTVENTLCQQLGYNTGHFSLGNPFPDSECSFQDPMLK